MTIMFMFGIQLISVSDSLKIMSALKFESQSHENIFNLYATGNTSVCGQIFEPADNITACEITKNYFFRIF